MKKILVLSNNDIGLYNFRKEILVGLIDEGYEVYISLPYGERVDDLKQLGCIYHQTKIDRRGINPFKDIGLIFKYLNLFRQIKPHLILSYTIKPNIYGGMMARIKHIPYLTNITGIGSAFQQDGLLKKIMIKMYQIGVKKAKVIFFQNKENQHIFAENKIIGESTYLLSGSGVNLDTYQLAPLNQKEEVIYLFIGRIMKEKGIEEYFYAAEQSQKLGLKAKFHLVGSIEEEKYRERLDLLTKEGIIFYHGFNKNIYSHIQECDCVVLPSYHEGMSNTLLEGAASGRPLIASDISGCRETIDDGINGFLVEKSNSGDLFEKIKKFNGLSNEQRQQMGIESRQKIEKEFDRRLIVKKYLETAFQVIGGSTND